MEELITNKRIRCNFSDEDMKFFAPKQPSKRTERKVSSTHETKSKHTNNKLYTISLKLLVILLSFATLISGIVGVWVGMTIEKEQSKEINHMKESLIRLVDSLNLVILI